MTFQSEQLINSSQGKYWLENSVSSETVSVDLCSAYLKVGSLEYFHKHFLNKGFVGKSRVLARWQLSDLISGASDLESYLYAKEHEISFFVMQNFHGKIYGINPGGVLVGSANLTNLGFGLVQNPNEEVCVFLSGHAEKNFQYINSLIEGAVLITDEIFERINKFISSSEEKKLDKMEWPNEIFQLLIPSQKTYQLIIDDMFHSNLNNKLTDDEVEMRHDLSLLGITKHDLNNKELVKKNLLRAKPYLWLHQSLSSANSPMYFGELSAKLHNDLVNDPKLYRKDVKQLLQNLLSWIGELAHDEIVIDRPSYSQRVTLINRRNNGS